MTLAQLRARVYLKIRESTDSPVMWNDADINNSLNEGLHELADETEFHEVVETVTLQDRIPYYDARTLFGGRFLVAGPSFNKTTNRWMQHYTPLDLQLHDLRWEERIAEPEYVLVRGLHFLRYWPTLNGGGTEIKQYFKALPPYMTADIDVPPFSSTFHEVLIHYALWDLFAQDGEVDLAWASWKEYVEWEGRLRAHSDGRRSLPLRHGWRESNYGS